MLPVEITTPHAQPRLPSRRPLDRRWDQSRGIIFSKHRRSILQDFRRLYDASIVFAETPASRRGYPAKSRFTQQPSSPIPKQSSRQNLINNPNALSPSNVETNRASQGDMKKKLGEQNERIAFLELDLETAAKARQRSVENAAHAFRIHNAESQQLKLDIANRESVLEARAITVDKDEDNIRVQKSDLARREAAYATLIATAQRDAQGAASQKFSARNALAEQRESEAAAKISAFDIALHEQNSVFKDELRDHKAQLDYVYAQRSTEDMRLAEDAALARDLERSDYEAYHEVWDEAYRSINDLVFETKMFYEKLTKQATLWKYLATRFDGGKIHPWFPHKYHELNRQIQAYLDSSFENASTSATTVKDKYVEISRAKQHGLLPKAHTSRSLTRFHRFQESPSEYEARDLINIVLNEVPILDYRGRAASELEAINDRLAKTNDIGNKTTLQSRQVVLRSKTWMLSRVQYIWKCFREIDALTVMMKTTVSEKEVFVTTQEIDRMLLDASEAWTTYKSSEPADLNEKQERQAFVRGYRRARDQLQQFANDIRKRKLIQMHLGQVDSDEGRLDAEILKQIARAEAQLEDALNRTATGEGRSTRMQRAASKSAEERISHSSSFTPAESPEPRRQKSLISRRLTLHARRLQLRRRLKQTPGTYSSDEARRKDEKESIETDSQYYTLHLVEKKDQRAQLLRQSPVDHVKVGKSDIAIREMQQALDKLSTKRKKESMTMSSPEESQTFEKSPVTSTDLRSRTTDMSKMQADSQGQSTSAKSHHALRIGRRLDGAPRTLTRVSASVKSLKAGTLVFTPSASLKAAHHVPPAHLRNFHVYSARVSNPEPERSQSTSSSQSLWSSLSNVLRSSQPSHSLSASMKDEDVQIDSQADNKPTSTIPMQPTELQNQVTSFDSASQNSSNSDMEIESADPSYQSSASQDSVSSALGNLSLEDTNGEVIDTTSAKAEEPDVELAYQIPAEDYRKAVLASKNTTASFWTYKLYKNAEGKTPELFYCTNFETTERQAKLFLNEPVIGFDIEWEPSASLAKSSIKDNVSLIQIACEDKIGLFQLAMFKEHTAERLMPPSLRAILESRDIAKTGVNIQGDARRLRECLNVDMSGLFELSHLYSIVTFSETQPEKISRRLFKMADQVQNVLLLPLHKGAVRTSAWSKKLNLEQTEYAGSDAYAGFRLYHALEAKRRHMDPTPPRPAFWEEHKPLVLGDGTVVVAKTYAPRKKPGAAVVEEDDDEGEEFFDAVENLGDADQLASSHQPYESAGVPLSGISYPSLPALDTFAISEAPNHSSAHEDQRSTSTSGRPQTKSFHPSEKDSTAQAGQNLPKKLTPSSFELDRADTWVLTFRASLPPEYNLRVGNSTLRAYHLWHEQRHSCVEVANLMRDPPLSINTVASYVMQALKEEDLPFEGDRVKDVLGILPASVHGRYGKVLRKIEQG